MTENNLYMSKQQKSLRMLNRYHLKKLFFWYPKSTFSQVLFCVFFICKFICFEFFINSIECIRDVFEENQSKCYMLVFTCIHTATQLVSSEKQFCFKT